MADPSISLHSLLSAYSVGGDVMCCNGCGAAVPVSDFDREAVHAPGCLNRHVEAPWKALKGILDIFEERSRGIYDSGTDLGKVAVIRDDRTGSYKAREYSPRPHCPMHVGEGPTPEAAVSDLVANWLDRGMPRSVVLLDVGHYKAKVTRCIREMADMNLPDVVQALKNLPLTVVSGVEQSEAEAVAKILKSMGASVEIVKEGSLK